MVHACVILSLGPWTGISGLGLGRALGMVFDFVCKSESKVLLRNDGASLVLPAWVLLSIQKLSFLWACRWGAWCRRVCFGHVLQISKGDQSKIEVDYN